MITTLSEINEPTGVSETTHLLLTSKSASDSNISQTQDHAYCILLSTTASRFGSRTWEFATPLLLLEWIPGSLAAPAAFGLTCALFRTIVSPILGRCADSRWLRLHTVTAGTAMQAGASLLSVGALAISNALSFSEMSRFVLLVFVIFSGVIETLGAQLSTVAVKKEWVPIVFDEGTDATQQQQQKEPHNYTFKRKLLNIFLPERITLSFINTAITKIDLMAAIFGPVLGGWILEVSSNRNGSLQFGFVAIALLNAISFIPEILLLRRVYFSCPALQKRNHQECTDSTVTEEVRTSNGLNPWMIWYNHPSGLQLLSISLASLYLTALSPAGVVLTAYLVTIGVSTTNIGVFRGVGAISGVFGISLFSVMRNCGNLDDEDATVSKSPSTRSIERLRLVSLACLSLEICSIIVATAAYFYCDSIYAIGAQESSYHVQVIQPMSGNVFIFLTAIVISRAGLYSFDVGVLEIEQYIVDERYRNAVGSVEGALCSLAEMGIYVLSIALPDPKQFKWQVGISAMAICAGGASFVLFLCTYHMHLHYHDEGRHNHDHNHRHSDHEHMHTLQQERDLKNGYHTHLHRHIPHRNVA